MTSPTQSDRVLAFLFSENDPTAMEIAMGCHPWVSNPRARISDLRKAGYVIEAVKRPDGKTGFRLNPPFDGTLGLAS